MVNVEVQGYGIMNFHLSTSLFMEVFSMAVECLTPFLTLLQLYSCNIYAFLEFLLLVALHKILSKPLAAFQHNQGRNRGQQ